MSVTELPQPNPSVSISFEVKDVADKQDFASNVNQLLGVNGRFKGDQFLFETRRFSSVHDITDNVNFKVWAGNYGRTGKGKIQSIKFGSEKYVLNDNLKIESTINSSAGDDLHKKREDYLADKSFRASEVRIIRSQIGSFLQIFPRHEFRSLHKMFEKAVSALDRAVTGSLDLDQVTFQTTADRDVFHEAVRLIQQINIQSTFLASRFSQTVTNMDLQPDAVTADQPQPFQPKAIK